jgi:hypothetical protein
MRESLLSLSEKITAQENKGDKMVLLYHYLTGNEFKGHLEAMMEGWTQMKNNITRERVAMEKLWKEREKQLDKVLINTSGLYGSIKGIAGASISEIKMLEYGDDETP